MTPNSDRNNVVFEAMSVAHVQQVMDRFESSVENMEVMSEVLDSSMSKVRPHFKPQPMQTKRLRPFPPFRT